MPKQDKVKLPDEAAAAAAGGIAVLECGEIFEKDIKIATAVPIAPASPYSIGGNGSTGTKEHS